jgi:hypothetical protein
LKESLYEAAQPIRNDPAGTRTSSRTTPVASVSVGTPNGEAHPGTAAAAGRATLGAGGPALAGVRFAGLTPTVRAMASTARRAAFASMYRT